MLASLALAAGCGAALPESGYAAPRPDPTQPPTREEYVEVAQLETWASPVRETVLLSVGSPRFCRGATSQAQLAEPPKSDLTTWSKLAVAVVVGAIAEQASELGAGAQCSLALDPAGRRAKSCGEGQAVAPLVQSGTPPPATLPPISELGPWMACGSEPRAGVPVRLVLADGTVVAGETDGAGQVELDLGGVKGNASLLHDPVALVEVAGQRVGKLDLFHTAIFTRWQDETRPWL